MRWLVAAVAALVLLATTAAAGAQTPSRPAAVGQAIEGLMRDCRGFGGRPSLMADFQTILDLNGDSQPDYILDVGLLDCEGAASALCAGVGCPIHVFLSAPDGYRDASPGVFAKGWEIETGTRPPTIVMTLDAAACGPRARGPCTRRYRWNGSTMALVGTVATAPPAAATTAAPAPPSATAPAGRPAIAARAQNDIFAVCRESGGRPRALQGFETIIDLNGDSQPDYIQDAAKVECQGAPSALCGSAGCPLAVYLSGPSGYSRAFGGYAQDWRLDRAASPPVLVTEMHGSACGRVGSATCTKRYAWNGRQFAEVRAGAAPGRPAPGGASGGDKVETALPRPAPPAWSLRETPGNPPVATASGPGAIESIALLCFEGAPVAAFVMRARPPPGQTVLSLGFRGGAVNLVLAEHPEGGGRIFQSSLAGTAVPRLMVRGDGGVPVRINGGLHGTLSLAGSGSVVREALAGCYRF